jgi:hypothetical protein
MPKLSIALIVCSIPVLLTTGCVTTTVNFDPATQTDPTPATVDLLIKSSGFADTEVQARAVPPAPRILAFGTLGGTTRRDFSVLATAKDPESGIRHIKLSMTRTVCYRTANGTIAQAQFPTVARKEATYTDEHNAPIQATLGDSGVIDPNDLTSDNFLLFTDSQGNRRIAIGATLSWNMEAENFQGGSTTYSDVIYVTAGDTSCIP